jgi:hypothetical protein
MVRSNYTLRNTVKLTARHLVTLPASFNLWLATPEARFLKGKFLWCSSLVPKRLSLAGYSTSTLSAGHSILALISLCEE